MHLEWQKSALGHSCSYGHSCSSSPHPEPREENDDLLRSWKFFFCFHLKIQSSNIWKRTWNELVRLFLTNFTTIHNCIELKSLSDLRVISLLDSDCFKAYALHVYLKKINIPVIQIFQIEWSNDLNWQFLFPAFSLHK
jgi:hypothetical protein